MAEYVNKAGGRRPKIVLFLLFFFSQYEKKKSEKYFSSVTWYQNDDVCHKQEPKYRTRTRLQGSGDENKKKKNETMIMKVERSYLKWNSQPYKVCKHQHLKNVCKNMHHGLPTIPYNLQLQVCISR